MQLALVTPYPATAAYSEGFMSGGVRRAYRLCKEGIEVGGRANIIMGRLGEDKGERQFVAALEQPQRRVPDVAPRTQRRDCWRSGVSRWAAIIMVTRPYFAGVGWTERYVSGGVRRAHQQCYRCS